MNQVLYYLQYSSDSIFPPGSWINEHVYYGEDIPQMESDMKAMAKKFHNRSWRILKWEEIRRKTVIGEIPRKKKEEEDGLG